MHTGSYSCRGGGHFDPGDVVVVVVVVIIMVMPLVVGLKVLLTAVKKVLIMQVYMQRKKRYMITKAILWWLWQRWHPVAVSMVYSLLRVSCYDTKFCKPVLLCVIPIVVTIKLLVTIKTQKVKMFQNCGEIV